MDILDRTTYLINYIVADVLTHLQDNYGQLLSQELLERTEIFKKTSYHPHEPIASVFSTFKELLEFADIGGISYTQHHSANITYVVIHSTVKFSLSIHKYNFMPTVQKMWFGFKLFFRTAHRELQDTTYFTVQDVGMHHANMVCDVVSELQEVFHK